MRKQANYLTETPLLDDVERLCDPSLSSSDRRIQVNELVLNVVVKYLAEYLEIQYETIEEMRKQIRLKLKESFECDRRFNPFISGVQVSNIYGDKPGVDAFPLRCHADIQKTAAIFKEIAFNQRFESDGSFSGIDLGSGTGILTLAMVIAAKRKKVEKIEAYGFEVRKRTAEKSRSALASLFGNEVKVEHTDLYVENNLRRALAKGHNYWVSETVVSNTLSATPFLDIFKKDLGISDLDLLFRRKEKHTDPFVEILMGTLKEDPEFFDKVRDGKIAMFPDIASGLFRPNKENTRIILSTGPKRILPLHSVGQEFRNYEGMGLRVERWGKPEVRKKKVIKKKASRKKRDETPQVEDKAGQLSLFEE